MDASKSQPPECRTYSFEGRKKNADALIPDSRKMQILREVFSDRGAVDVLKASPEEDRKGIDFWVILRDGGRIAVDVKVKAKDYGDAPLEILSVVERAVPGWTVRPDSKTDYAVFIYADTGTVFRVPFQLLRAVTLRNLPEWRMRYRVRENGTTEYGGYKSEWLPVPRYVIEAEIQALLNRDAAGHGLN